MRRLKDEDTLASRLELAPFDHGFVEPRKISELARQLAEFHAGAERNERIATFGRPAIVAANARGNFEQSRSQIGNTVSAQVFARLERRTEELLDELLPLLDSRAARGIPCDTHGDLRADHVYFVENHAREPSTVVIDCLEFNDAFRYADPIADMAFLAMDLRFANRHDLADAFTESYFSAAEDEEGRRLLPFYVAYRAAVRAKVEGLQSTETEVLENEREAARARATGYWMLALGAIEPPERRPALVLVGGLPGSGKSTLAKRLAEQANFEVIRTDTVRKELAGTTTNNLDQFGEGLYTAEWNARTYGECLLRAEARLLEGRRVIVDASFREDAGRRLFLQLADRLHVPAQLLICEAPPEVVRTRLAQRQGDASDADTAIYEQAARVWELAADDVAPRQHFVQAGGSLDRTLSLAQTALRAVGIVD